MSEGELEYLKKELLYLTMLTERAFRGMLFMFGGDYYMEFIGLSEIGDVVKELKQFRNVLKHELRGYGQESREGFMKCSLCGKEYPLYDLLCMNRGRTANRLCKEQHHLVLCSNCQRIVYETLKGIMEAEKNEREGRGKA
ncbi:hypothetical protein J7L00_03490 [Candidatus Bathyarchaeota archaeon]|nr:hypothetical protein [Candidatus Bathyarchaeota archaeon]